MSARATNAQLAAGIHRLKQRAHKAKFATCAGTTSQLLWQQTDHETGELLRQLWNARADIAAALSLLDAARANPERFLPLEAGGCTCLTKTNAVEYHAHDCVYAAVARALEG